MSQLSHERHGAASSNGCIGIRNYRYPSPRLSQNSDLQGDSSLVDGSWPLFNMYLGLAREEDTAMAEGWKADAEGILFFTGLFSAAVATLLCSSMQALLPSSPGNQTSYPANVYQTAASNSPTPPAQSNLSSTYSPPTYAVLINTLWFLSLSISLTCALLATLQQQWARRYIMITHKRHHPRNRARIRSFFAEGVNKLHLPLAVEVLPALLHSSLFLFFAGLVVFLYHINLTVFKIVAAWVGVCTFLYTCVTLLPIFRHDSPYYTPLSSLVWFIYTGLLFVFFHFLRWLTAFHCFRREIWERFRALRGRYRGWFLHGMEKAAEDFALALPSDIDGRALIWTLETLDEDDELEAFFEGIPGFCNSAAVPDPLAAFKILNGEKMSEALVGFMCNTLSSNLVPEPIKRRRIEICINAVEAASLSINRRIFDRILYKDWGELSSSVEFGLFLKRISYCDAFSAYYSQCVISVIIATAQERDMRWSELAMDQLNISKANLQEYLGHGDSLTLAICISICRCTIDAYYEHGWYRDVYAQSKTFDVVSNFDVHHTLLGLKRDFCVLWNELVKSAQSRNNEHIPISILRNIRKVYISLHQDTTHAGEGFFTCPDDDRYLSSPFFYPSCNIPSHHPNSTLCANEAVAVTTMDASHSLTSSSQAPPFPQPDSAPTSTVPSTGPHFQSSLQTDGCIDTTLQPSISIHAHTRSLFELAQPPSLCPTNSSATAIQSTVNKIQLPMETGPSLPFPIPAHDNLHPTDPPSFLSAPVSRLNCSQQTHSGVIRFPSPSVTRSSLTPSRASFVSSPSSGHSMAVGVYGDAQELSLTTLTECSRHPQQVVPSGSFPDEAHRDAKLSVEDDDVMSGNPTLSPKCGTSTDKQS